MSKRLNFRKCKVSCELNHQDLLTLLTRSAVTERSISDKIDSRCNSLSEGVRSNDSNLVSLSHRVECLQNFVERFCYVICCLLVLCLIISII